MSNFTTSRVFDAARKMRDRLKDQSWPPHPITTEAPQVALSDPDWDTKDEIIWVWPEFGEDAAIDWRQLPNGRMETFTIVVAVTSFVVIDDDNTAEDWLIDRLEELADVVQRAVYDDTDTATSENTRFNPLGVDGVNALGGVSQVSFSIIPVPREGLQGRCLVRYEHSGRI